MSASAAMWMSTQEGWFLDVNHFARSTPALQDPLKLYASYGVVLFAAVLLLAWWRARQHQDFRAMAAALWSPVGALLALGLNQPLVSLFREPRPFTVFPNALVLVSRSQDYSFPSDHAVMAGAVTAGVLLVHRRLGLVTAVAAVMMAFDRVYVGAHFPLDVVAGLLIGSAVTWVGYLLLRTRLHWAVTQLGKTRLRPLLTASHRIPAS